MNRVSDLNLAVACEAAGVLPSLSSFNYHEDEAFGAMRLAKDLIRFAELTNSTRLLLSLRPRDIFNGQLIDFLCNQGFKLLEIPKWDVSDEQWRAVTSHCRSLSDVLGFEFFFKIHRRSDALDGVVQTVVFKGNEGAGRTDPDAGTLAENFAWIRTNRPDVKLIPSGGISTPDMVAHYLARGASAIGIGTLFAAAAESPVSVETKLKMIQANAADLSRIGKFSHQGLVFSRLEGDNDNHTGGLKLGISQGDAGTVFAGKGIDHVKEILPVSEIVARLIADIRPA